MLARLVNEERTPPTALQVEPEPRLSRSMRTTSLTPASARWNAQLVPMTPPPMMTTSALGGTAFSANLASTISVVACRERDGVPTLAVGGQALAFAARHQSVTAPSRHRRSPGAPRAAGGPPVRRIRPLASASRQGPPRRDRKSTRLNSSHVRISY